MKLSFPLRQEVCHQGGERQEDDQPPHESLARLRLSGLQSPLEIGPALEIGVHQVFRFLQAKTPIQTDDLDRFYGIPLLQRGNRCRREHGWSGRFSHHEVRNGSVIPLRRQSV